MPAGEPKGWTGDSDRRRQPNTTARWTCSCSHRWAGSLSRRASQTMSTVSGPISSGSGRTTTGPGTDPATKLCGSTARRSDCATTRPARSYWLTVSRMGRGPRHRKQLGGAGDAALRHHGVEHAQQVQVQRAEVLHGLAGDMVSFISHMPNIHQNTSGFTLICNPLRVYPDPSSKETP